MNQMEYHHLEKANIIGLTSSAMMTLLFEERIVVSSVIIEDNLPFDVPFIKGTTLVVNEDVILRYFDSYDSQGKPYDIDFVAKKLVDETIRNTNAGFVEPEGSLDQHEPVLMDNFQYTVFVSKVLVDIVKELNESFGHGVKYVNLNSMGRSRISSIDKTHLCVNATTLSLLFDEYFNEKKGIFIAGKLLLLDILKAEHRKKVTDFQ